MYLQGSNEEKLFMAVKSGNILEVQEALKNPLDPFSADEDGATAFLTACILGSADNNEIINEFLKDYRFVNIFGNRCVLLCVDKNEISPMLAACQIGNLPLLKQLVEKGINPKMATGAQMITPLHVACEMGFREGIKYLVEECGCDLYARDSRFQTPFLILQKKAIMLEELGKWTGKLMKIIPSNFVYSPTYPELNKAFKVPEEMRELEVKVSNVDSEKQSDKKRKFEETADFLYPELNQTCPIQKKVEQKHGKTPDNSTHNPRGGKNKTPEGLGNQN